MGRFAKMIRDKAAQGDATIVFSEGNDPAGRPLAAAEICVKQKIAKPVVIGDITLMKKRAEGNGIDLTGVQLIDPSNDPERLSRYANGFYELRKSKGITLEQAAQIVRSPHYFATMGVKMGDFDGLVAGCMMTSADTERPYLQIIKGMPGLKSVSSCFVMEVPDCPFGDEGLFVYADCGMIIEPTVEQLVDIAYAASLTARELCNMEPRVAFISASTKGSIPADEQPIIKKVVDATDMFKEKYPDIIADGEMQIDAAIMPSVCRSKAPGSPLVEKGANVLIFPDLNAGNSAYKITQRLARADAFGPLLQGIALPCHDLSRGSTAEDIATVAAIAAVQANALRESGERENRILRL